MANLHSSWNSERKDLGLFHSFESSQLMDGSSRGRFHEGDADIFPLRQAELDVDQEIEGVFLEAADHEDRAGEGDPGNGEQCLEGAPLEMTENHAARLG